MLKELIACIGEYKRDTILAPVFVFFEVLLEVLIPLVMAKLLDNGITAGNMGYVYKCGLILIVMAMVSLVFGALSGVFAAHGSAGYGKNLRKRMYDSIQSFSFANIDHFSTAGLITRMTTDVTNVQMAYMMIVRIAVRCPAMLILALIFAFQIHAKLSLVFLIGLPILGIGLYVIMIKTFPLFTKLFKTYDKFNNVVEENLRGIRVVKSYVREGHEINKFGDTSEELYSYAVMAEKILVLNNPLMMFVIYLCMLAIAWFGAHFIVAGSLTTGGLVSMITYTMQILMSLMMLSMVFVMITMSRASAVRITEVLTEEPDLKNPENPVFNVESGDIDFKDVSFRYETTDTGDDAGEDCLKHLDIHIPSGSVVGILGNTGSGKSCLVQLIPRLYDATRGSVMVGGKDVKDYDMEALRNAVAMVLQKNVLFRGTIEENLRWGNSEATEEEMKRAAEIAAADSFIEELPDGYKSFVDQEGANFSGGQRQRLCIARALLKKPKILIMDDSTSAVDMATDSRIRQALKDYMSDTTKITIAQRVASVEDADIIIVLEEGKILATGTHRELMESCSSYRETAISQQKGSDDDARTA